MRTTPIGLRPARIIGALHTTHHKEGGKAVDG